MNNPILHLLGLSKRAGKLEIGEEPVGAAARAKQAKLILLASDAPPSTSRRAATFGQIGNVLQISLPFTKEEIGMSLGRGSIAMLALTDAGFAGAIGDKLVLIDAEKYGPAGAQLRAKADRTYARQKEKRQHEKNLQKGKGKPWAVPPKVAEEKARIKQKKRTGSDSNYNEGNGEYPKTKNKRPNFKESYQKEGNKSYSSQRSETSRNMRGSSSSKNTSKYGTSSRNDTNLTGKTSAQSRYSSNSSRPNNGKPPLGKRLVVKGTSKPPKR